MSSSKPRSISRSASSRHTTLHESRWIRFLRSRSSSRPGVATTAWTPFLSAARSTGAPPMASSARISAPAPTCPPGAAAAAADPPPPSPPAPPPPPPARAARRSRSSRRHSFRSRFSRLARVTSSSTTVTVDTPAMSSKKPCTTSRVWRASSLLGQMSSATGPSPAVSGSRASASHAARTAGSANASVLPLPVNAMPIMSRPARATGRPCIWMGDGRLMPLARIVDSSTGGSFISRNVTHGGGTAVPSTRM